jgi:hypothetical protein
MLYREHQEEGYENEIFVMNGLPYEGKVFRRGFVLF